MPAGAENVVDIRKPEIKRDQIAHAGQQYDHDGNGTR